MPSAAIKEGGTFSSPIAMQTRVAGEWVGGATGFTDDFTGANGALLPRTGWEAAGNALLAGTDADADIASNTLANGGGDAAYAGVTVSQLTLPVPFHAAVELGSVPGADEGDVEIDLVLPAPYLAETTVQAYSLYISTSGGMTWSLARFDDGSATQTSLDEASTTALAPADAIAISYEAAGVVRGWERRSGVWTAIVSGTDATYDLSAGFVTTLWLGKWGAAATFTLDNLEIAAGVPA